MHRGASSHATYIAPAGETAGTAPCALLLRTAVQPGSLGRSLSRRGGGPGAVVRLAAGAFIPPNIKNDFQLLEKDRDYSFVVDSDNNFVGIESIQPMSDPNKSLAVRYTKRV